MSTTMPHSPPKVREPPQAYQRHQHNRRPFTPERRRDHRLIAGTILVLLGVGFLVETITNWALLGVLTVPTLGLVFAFWGGVTRRAGLLIPGSILLGVGTGAALVDAGVAQGNGTEQGAIVVLCLALGFAAIIPLTWAFTARMHWWALIPAGVLALVGMSMVAGEWGNQVLIWLGRLWPIVLVFVGALVLWDVARNREKR